MAVAAVSCAGLLAGLGAAAPAAASESRGNGAAAPSCASWTSVQPPSPGTANSLGGVAVLSSGNAWAVGSYDPLNGDPTAQLIEHWDGTTWKQVASPRHSGILYGVPPSRRPISGRWAA